MFLMLDVRSTGLSGDAFARRLLEEEDVSVLPGEGFGPSAAGHVRICVTTDETRLREACRRIARCADRLAAATAEAGISVTRDSTYHPVVSETRLAARHACDRRAHRALARARLPGRSRARDRAARRARARQAAAARG